MWYNNIFIIRCFLFYCYYKGLLCDLWNKYFKKSTKLVLPDYPVYFAKCFIYKPTNLTTDVYHLYYESHTDELSPLLTDSNQTIYLYHDSNTDIILCNKNVNEHTRLPKKSTARFINILYSNPDSNKEPLTLRLDHSYLYEGNEILGAPHVFYLLKTQYENAQYTFNLNYQLKIMDGNFAITVINSNKYICLTDCNKGFSVNDINKCINE